MGTCSQHPRHVWVIFLRINIDVTMLSIFKQSNYAILYQLMQLCKCKISLPSLWQPPLPNEPPTASFPHPPIPVRLQAGGQRLHALAPYDEELWGDALLVQGQYTRLVEGW